MSRKRFIKKRTKKKYKIKDVSISDRISLGDDATSGKIGYHYLNYENTYKYFTKVCNNKNILCIPNTGDEWMKSLMRLYINKSKNDVIPADYSVTITSFLKEVTRCINKSRLVPISLQIIVPNIGTHANMIIIDSKKKTIELFEPHGNRDVMSSLEGISRGYYKINRNIHRFFSKNFKNYKYISPDKYLPLYGLQSRIDAYDGMCVTWNILYLHYRILNPDIPIDKLAEYLNKHITKDILLKYAHNIERVMKNM